MCNIPEMLLNLIAADLEVDENCDDDYDGDDVDDVFSCAFL